MAGEKIFIGPKLRKLRQNRKLTQAELANTIGVSASYVNLIERNQRSASLKFLISLSDKFGVNWRELANTDTNLLLSDLRQVTNDPAFGEVSPDIEELRSAVESAPNLVLGLINLYDTYRTYGERLAELNENFSSARNSKLSIEQSVHDFFRNNNNHFAELEAAAEACYAQQAPDRQEIYGWLRTRLKDRSGVSVVHVRDEVLGMSMTHYDPGKKLLMLSDGLDHQNKVFQLAFNIAMIEHCDLLDRQLPDNLRGNHHAADRCRIELANYFAAAMVMPYEEFYEEAQLAKYDIDRLTARFSVSFEQVCHRLTTLQRPGKRGIPFFFLRIDRGGNVSKRFNVTPIQLAKYGGACPRLDVHYCFRVPGRIMTQIVEMPDHSRYLTINRTVDRPAIHYSTDDKRLAISIGCAVEHAPETVYGLDINPNATRAVTKIGINCRLCPRQDCQQRAHDPFYSDLKLEL